VEKKAEIKNSILEFQVYWREIVGHPWWDWVFGFGGKGNRRENF
jgi:hypothetical protein